MDNKKEIITAVGKVRSYCHNQENCLDCIFYDIDLDCCNIQGIPDDLMIGFIAGFHRMKFS